ncbi:MAG: NADPH:quinone oxidoreductase family protein [Gammaproteobacteria bacterium]|nr:MAG: NADPH:quinone oxidoreductase family protein [Gammaproteobacteria bacterium]
MRAVLCKEFGPPGSLVMEDVAEPELDRGQVRIAIRACGVNFPDLLMIAGKYQQQPPMPFSPGAELAGDVIEIASDVADIEQGQRVIAVTGFGGMAEQICVHAQKVVPLPDAIDYVPAAAFLLAYGTAYHALKQRAQLQAGETLAVLGAAGGVGLAAVEIGKLIGATVIAAASTTDKLKLTAEYGADHLINYTDTSLKDGIHEITAGAGADVIYDPVGGELFEQSLRAVAWRGRVLVIGFASGQISKIPANLPLLKGSSIVGVFWGRFTEEEPETNAENTAELFRLLQDGKLKPHVSETYPLEKSALALEALAARRAKGKIVIKI